MKAWIVTVDMGLGHQRAVYPLADLAEGGLITLGRPDEGLPRDREARLWHRLQGTYERVSRLLAVPLIGKPLFGLMDTLMEIPPYYPRRDLSRPTFQVRLMRSFVDRGICRSMLETVAAKSLPVITSYPAPAVAADAAGLDPVYSIVCDAEISRAWVAADPAASRIHYLAPCERAVMRLRSYGVPAEKISLTGFPFPTEITGGRDLGVLKADLAGRLCRLDPAGRFRSLLGQHVAGCLGEPGSAVLLPEPGAEAADPDQPPSLTFAVGGAGAQREIGRQVAVSLKEMLRAGRIRLNLVAGVRGEVRDYFLRVKEEVAPENGNLRIVYGRDKDEYFRLFSALMRETDILWTKPSELSFYCGLGLPVIVAPTIGCQETYNRKWLLEIQAGIDQEAPEYAAEWLADLLASGRLAEAAWNGYLHVRKTGTFAIRDLVAARQSSRASA
jgi:hypothetical protein